MRKERVSAPLPVPLPVAHVTVARWLDAILGVGELQPQHCDVFGKSLLYFSYGGVFYRPTRLNTQHAVDWPIGMVFSPGVLEAVTSVYPFDTGAMARNAYFEKWRKRLAPFRTRFRIKTTNALATAPRLVKLLYATNRRYVTGNVARSASRRMTPIPLLASFLGADMTPHVDHRQRTIECIAESAVAFAEHLEWVGVPDRALERVAQGVYRWTHPRMPVLYPYRPTRNFNPADIAAEMHAAARAAFVQRFLDLEK